MLSSLDNAITQINQQKQIFQKICKDALNDAFKEVFDLFPEVAALRFTGYTPYFMDGDPCTYSVNDLEVKFVMTGPVDLSCPRYNCKNTVQSLEKFCSQCGHKQPTLEERADVWHDYYGSKKSNQTLYDVLRDFSRKLHSLGDEILGIFGDHKRVTLSRDGEKLTMMVEDYEHD